MVLGIYFLGAIGDAKVVVWEYWFAVEGLFNSIKVVLFGIQFHFTLCRSFEEEQLTFDGDQLPWNALKVLFLRSLFD